MLVIWKERANPFFARAGARSGVTSWPAKRIEPWSGRRSPESWLMKVVLPAPLGPITACVSPSRTSKSMPSQARRAPKLFESPRTSNSMSFITRSRNDAGEPGAEEDHRQDEQRTEDDLPVLGPSGEIGRASVGKE